MDFKDIYRTLPSKAAGYNFVPPNSQYISQGLVIKPQKTCSSSDLLNDDRFGNEQPGTEIPRGCLLCSVWGRGGKETYTGMYIIINVFLCISIITYILSFVSSMYIFIFPFSPVYLFSPVHKSSFSCTNYPFFSMGVMHRRQLSFPHPVHLPVSAVTRILHELEGSCPLCLAYKKRENGQRCSL